jgi:hypothetical protein
MVRLQQAIRSRHGFLSLLRWCPRLPTNLPNRRRNWSDFRFGLSLPPIFISPSCRRGMRFQYRMLSRSFAALLMNVTTLPWRFGASDTVRNRNVPVFCGRNAQLRRSCHVACRVSTSRREALSAACHACSAPGQRRRDRAKTSHRSRSCARATRRFRRTHAIAPAR